MKNKKLLFILVPSVVAIWTLIFYKIINYTKSPVLQVNSNISIDTTNFSEKNMVIIPIIAKYRDPFLGYIKNESSKPEISKNIHQKNHNITTNKQPLKTYVNWPRVSYKGMIYNKQTNEKIALIKINYKDRLMTINQIVDDCELLMIYSDSVVLQFKKTKKTFYK
ncbi:MAG: hypothetical protein GXO79_12965 [Chlorobi bacterium]|nr:hypothetical protein [Chlorobiota bacterium]